MVKEMNKETFNSLIESGELILDGAMGTSLQKLGLKAGEKPELLCLSAPQLVKKVHEEFIKAGAKAIYTNTFGANRIKLGDKVEEIIFAAVNIAKEAAGESVAVLLDLGPTGKLLKPYGELEFESAYELFLEAVTAGKKAGAHGVVFETFSSLNELRAAVLAAAQVDLAVFATMSFEASGRTFLGVTPSAFSTTIGNMRGVRAIGVNCSLGPKSLAPIVKEIAAFTDLPVIAKPNAGLPDGDGKYSLDSGEFAKECFGLKENGASILGGCCGTTPEFIKELKLLLETRAVATRKLQKTDAVCSAKRVVELCSLQSETIEANQAQKTAIVEAYLTGDTDYLTEMALEQEDDGLEIINLNLSLLDGENCPLENIELALQAISTVSSLPVYIDSGDKDIVLTALRAFEGRALVGTNCNVESEISLYGAAIK